MNTVALKAAPASRLARFWQIVRREASRAVALHVESCGMMAELYRRSATKPNLPGVPLRTQIRSRSTAASGCDTRR